MLLLSDIHYLIGIAIVLNIATSSPAFVVIEVALAEGNSGEILIVRIKPASTWRVGPHTTTGAAHVVDDSVHIDVDLGRKDTEY